MKSKKTFITVQNAYSHNLKNIKVQIPMGELVVMTGVSGSGKSSLAFDTLYAEGQRRYVKSLSSYARQFLGRMDKPQVETIDNLPPAIAIEQKVNTQNTRSTVGTSSEIYEYLKLLFARVGKTVSPESNKEVQKDTVDSVVQAVFTYPKETRCILLSPIIRPSQKEMIECLRTLMQQGFSRVFWQGKPYLIEDFIVETPEEWQENNSINLLIDRIVIDENEELQSRFADSLETAFYEGDGKCIIEFTTVDGRVSQEHFSNKFEADGYVFQEPTVHMFTFNSPIGACPECNGYGTTLGISPELVIKNPRLSIYEDAVGVWRGVKMSAYKNQFIKQTSSINFPIHTPYRELTDEQKELLWDGSSGIEGIYDTFAALDKERYKIQNRVLIARYKGRTVCPKCKGSRLKKEAQYVQVGGKTIGELVNYSILELRDFFKHLKLNTHEQQISNRLLKEISNRIVFLCDVGLGYLTLNRPSASLSGGESQRINLATALGSSLVGSLYVLDEPSIGLHPIDNEKLIGILKQLCAIGNTVLVVEHDEDMMKAADYIIDIGPYAGQFGGEVVFSGTYKQLISSGKSLTSDYLSGKKQVTFRKSRTNSGRSIWLKGAGENNLKGVDVEFPLHCLTVVCGVSGSGKTSLIVDTLYPALVKERMEVSIQKMGTLSGLEGDLEAIKRVELVDQNPIGRSSRSNPATYTKVYDEIRQLFAEQAYAKQSGFTPSHFSFNIEGGRCEHCKGDGTVTIDMQFLADVQLPCEYCKGKRFKEAVLEVRYKNYNIHDVLSLTVDEALSLFAKDKSNLCAKIVKKLTYLEQVGLGYVQLGQSSSSLSGGESQRVKLASFLSNEKSEPTLFIFDEPTTGLHFDDISKLIKSMDRLLDHGHSIIVIEHNMEIIKAGDYIIEMGPTGGNEGGVVIFSGTPTDLEKEQASPTGKSLRKNQKLQ